MQNEAAAGHSADLAGVCAAGDRRHDRDAVGHARPHGEAPQEPHHGDQRHRPRSYLPATGLIY